jgi:hypothetical protein
MYEMDKSGHILIETGSVTLSGDSTFFFPTVLIEM